MEKKLLVASSVLAILILLSVGGWYIMGGTDKGGMSERSDTPSLTGQANGAVFEERRSVDIDAVTAEIINAAGEDLEALEAEIDGEADNFTEGAVLMENLGKSYDETEY